MFSVSLIEFQIARFKYTAVIYLYFFSQTAKKALYMYVGMYTYKIKTSTIHTGWLFPADPLRGANWPLEDIMGSSPEEFLCMEGIPLLCSAFNGPS